ncbi:zinc finger BED domain-containing protein 4-like isoform X1 [Chanodichthys erythropterus]|uniref:zinc finger BED domain-containing protein 4-like isoform X1 n=1 Tax=Chanodichthys erythropterus TaxID=933992 RepID=UPI00351E254E
MRKHSSVLHRAEMASDDGGEGSAMPTPPPLKQATLSSTSASITQSKVNSLVLEFIIADVQPFSLVDNASFREMIAGISGGRTHMCRKTLMQRIERGFQNMKEAITETLQDVQTVCTTADIWTAHHRSFMGITCHWIEPETLDRKSAALACERTRGRHTYDVIAAKVSQIHAEFQIQGKVSATVTDNGSNFVKAFSEYGGCEMDDEMDNTDDVQFADVSAVLQEEQEEEELNFFLPPHHRCAAHTLNLIATTDLDKAASQGVSRKLYRSAMSKCAAIWNKAHRSSGAADAIEEIAQMRCLVPSVTRWSSEYHAIEKLMSLTESQLNGICDQLKLAKLHPQETMFLIEYTAILKPLAYSINLLQGEKNCYFGYIVPTILSLKAKLAEKLTQVQFSAHILSAVIKAIDTRFGQVLASHEARMAASTIPKFRLWWLADEERGAMKTAMVQESRLLHKEPSEDAGTTGNAAVGGDPEDDENFFTFETTQMTSSSAEEEVQRYLQDPDKSLASLKMYPMIRDLFLKYNTTLPSSAPVERLFSQGGLIFTPHRNKMTDKHFEQALLLRYNRLYWSVDM